MREHRPVIALDFPSLEAVKKFLALFPEEESLYLKVGMELYYAAGPEIVSYLKGLGHSVFLDLKLHDIPQYSQVSNEGLVSAWCGYDQCSCGWGGRDDEGCA